MIIAFICMIVFFASLILNSMMSLEDYYEQMHNQYQDGESQQYMDTMAEHEKEDKVRAEFDFNY